MIVFLYTAPCFTVLGLHWGVPGERLLLPISPAMALAFAGIAFGFMGDNGGAPTAWVGDLLGLLAAIGWAATTVMDPAPRRFPESAPRGCSGTSLSPLLGEPSVALTPPVLLAFASNRALAAFASYLWFWLLTRGSRRAADGVLVPHPGLRRGLRRHLPRRTADPSFIIAAGCVAASIVLVKPAGAASP